MTVHVSSIACAARQTLEGRAQRGVGFVCGEAAKVLSGIRRHVRSTVARSRRRFDARWPHEHAEAGGAVFPGDRSEQLCFTEAQLRSEGLVFDEQAQLMLITGDDVAKAPEFFSEHAAQATLQCDEAFSAREHCAHTLSTIGIAATVGRQQLLRPQGTLRTRFQ